MGMGRGGVSGWAAVGGEGCGRGRETGKGNAWYKEGKGLGWAGAKRAGGKVGRAPASFCHEPIWQTKPGCHSAYCFCARSCNPAIAQLVEPLTVDSSRHQMVPGCLLRDDQLCSLHSPDAGGRHVFLRF